MALNDIAKRVQGAVRRRMHPPVTIDRFLNMPGPARVCPVCDATDVRWASAYPSDDRHFRLAVVCFCSSCGSGHVPDAGQLMDGYYETEFSEHILPDRKIDPETYFSASQKARHGNYYGRARAQLARLKELGAQFGDILDYGSGPGYLLHESGGERLFAVELDRASHKYLDYIGARLLDEDDVPADAFDVIVASHVFEHFTDAILWRKTRMLYDALRVGGMMLIEVPQGGHSYLKLTSTQEPHTIFYTPAGLRSLLSRLGGEITATYCRGGGEGLPLAVNPIYRPPADDSFAASRRGGITVIIRKTFETADTGAGKVER